MAAWRCVALVLATAGAVVLLVLACWLGTRGRPHADDVPPAPAAETFASALAALPSVSEAPPPADSTSPVAPTPPDNQAAAAPPPMTVSPDPQEPPAPSPAAPDQERKPEDAPPPAAAPPPPAPEKAPVRRRSDRSEDDLRKQLAEAPEFGLSPAARQALVRSYRTQYRSNTARAATLQFDPYTLLKHFPQAGELPLRSAAACQLGPKEAATLGVLARKLHAYLDHIALKDRDGKRTLPSRLREVLRQERRGQRPEWLRAEALPAMLQILMAEDVPLRLILVDLLAEVEAKPATVALAQRAVFDLAPEVRQAALDALRDRPRAESRPTLVNALRYPWEPAADHAAEALAALEDREAAPLLVAQLGKPDPEAPFATGKSGMAVRELVRVNHLANCLLCHAPAVSGADPVVGADPLVNLATRTGGGGRGWSSGGPTGSQSLLIRADVQFVRQDFSVTIPVGLPGVAVEGVRFDYLLRTRPLNAAEVRAWKQQQPADPTAYPQRDAALFALRALTGKDVGPTTEAWVQLFPDADAEAEGVRLSEALLRAAPEQRGPLLARYRDAKDDRYTEGLARAITHLEGKLQGVARAALVERLSRLSAEQLRARLQDDDDELRRAAALACVRKADKELVPELIGLLLDAEPEVAEGAQKMLKRLTGMDFGPAANADPEERVAAAAKWHEWWRGQTTP